MSFELFFEAIRLFNDGLNPKHINVKIITLDECESALEIRHYNNHQFKYRKHHSNEKVIVQMQEFLAHDILEANFFYDLINITFFFKS
jgi:disulfide oxidoreductase YuzD